ncbi:Heavy metal-associated isoprenylated plant protein 43 [Camellia lanceoleosa]|uniref:Heavy metal-associated isoprenylated plant protein 43 n=1 Tax=Camellia lanceoleosa TaxID=1840588 RepID=A0ACC0I8J8_9ERIC|nr:Heavy metal-associated isoprenylated plant protein 43 [Camellia lanceoleosa]
MKKIELKVGIHCQKCKTEVLKAVTKLTGIDHVSVDAEKGTLTVIGNVDPVCVTTQVRKTGKVVELISVGPPKPPEKKPQPPKSPICLPPCCKECQLVGITFVPYDGGSSCSIL